MDNFATPTRNKHVPNMLTIPASPFMQNLGYGTGAIVYRMIRSPTTHNCYRSPWAIKKVALHTQTSSLLAARLKEEAGILKNISHSNIVGFRAFVTNANGEKCLAMEDCEKSLGDMIEARSELCLQDDKFEAPLIMKVASDIASALEYLHNTALILHCDVKSFNVLVKGQFETFKLCDFGVSMPLSTDGTLSISSDEAEYIGTPAWCPREILQFPPIITDRVDIYALGLVLWEMMALSPPPQPQNENSLLMDNLLNGSDLDRTITIPSNHSRPDLPQVDFSRDYFYVLELFHCMTDDDYHKRPTATDLVIIVEEMRAVMDKERPQT